MKNIHAGKLASLACLLVASLHMGPAAAHLVYLCTATNTAANATVAENLEVQSGQACVLSGATVKGDVTADPGSILIIENSTQILGALTINTTAFSVTGSTILGPTVVAQTATPTAAPLVAAVFLCNNALDGPVTIQNVGAQPSTPGYLIALGTTAGFCTGNSIKGPLSVLNNAVAVLVENNSPVGGTVTVTGNTATPTSAAIEGNVITGGLKCSGNTALLGTGTNNAKGPETGQCAGF